MKPRWLGLLALLVVVLVSFIWLGLWQFDVARDHAQNKAVLGAPMLPVAPLAEVIAPHQEFPADGSGRRVTVSGRYDGAQQVLIADRRLDGVAGYWVTTPLVVATTGARLVVVRGFVSSPAQATPPTAEGPVQVGGTLAPGESPTSGAGLPPGQRSSIDLGALLNQWHGSIYNAFIFATSERPDVTAAVIQRIPPPPIQTHGLTWRNAAYALQWWLFALFACYLYWRTLRDDWEKDRAWLAATTHPDRPHEPGPPPGHPEIRSGTHPGPGTIPEKEAHV